MLASNNGHTKVVEHLIEAKASLDLQHKVCYASNYQDEQHHQQKLLIYLQTIRIAYYSACFLFQDGWNTVMFASNNGFTKSVKYLIEAKASFDLQHKMCYALNHENEYLLHHQVEF